MKAIDKNKPLLAEIERIRDDSLDRERLAWDDVIANVHDLQVDRDHWKGDYELIRQICLALVKAITGIDLVTFDLNGVVAQAEGQRLSWANLQSRDSFDGLRAEIDHKDQLIRNLQEGRDHLLVRISELGKVAEFSREAYKAMDEWVAPLEGGTRNESGLMAMWHRSLIAAGYLKEAPKP